MKMAANEVSSATPSGDALVGRGPAERRGRAYQCLRCYHKAEKVFIDTKKRMECHILKEHLSRDQVPFFCSLCQFRCMKNEELEDHLTRYRRHTFAAQQAGLDPGDRSCLRVNPEPYRMGGRDYLILEREESVKHWRELREKRCTTAGKILDPIQQAIDEVFPDGLENADDFPDWSPMSVQRSTAPSCSPASQRKSTPTPDQQAGPALAPATIQHGPYIATPVQTVERLVHVPTSSIPPGPCSNLIQTPNQHQAPSTASCIPVTEMPNIPTAIVSLDREELGRTVAPFLKQLTDLVGPDQLIQMLASNEVTDTGMTPNCPTGEPNQTKDDEVVESLMAQLLPTEDLTLTSRNSGDTTRSLLAPTKRMRPPSPLSESSDDEEDRKDIQGLKRQMERNTSAIVSLERTMLTLPETVTQLTRSMRAENKTKQACEAKKTDRRPEATVTSVTVDKSRDRKNDGQIQERATRQRSRSRDRRDRSRERRERSRERRVKSNERTERQKERAEEKENRNEEGLDKRRKTDHRGDSRVVLQRTDRNRRQ